MWKIQAGTHTGPHHRKFGQPNQDAWGVKDEPEYKLLIAADGAGSLELSHLGAQIAVNVVKRYVRDNHGTMSGRKLVKQAITSAREELLAQEKSELLGCTIAVAYITDKGWATGVNGDAFAVIGEAEGLSLSTSPPAGEYANITKLLTSKDFEVTLASGHEALEFIAVSTDGLVHAGLKEGEPFPGFWKPVVKWAKSDALVLEELFAHMDEQGKIDDDTTLVIAVTED